MLLQHAEQAALDLLVCRADLIEKQGTAVGELELPGPLPIRSGEGAFLVPKEFALQ